MSGAKAGKMDGALATGDVEIGDAFFSFSLQVNYNQHLQILVGFFSRRSLAHLDLAYYCPGIYRIYRSI